LIGDFVIGCSARVVVSNGLNVDNCAANRDGLVICSVEGDVVEG
jgi:hypothetical protein